jgi:hypothetical protein
MEEIMNWRASKRCAAHCAAAATFTVSVGLFPVAPASAQPSVPDFSGIWQKGPLAEFQPIAGFETAVKPIGGPLNERDPFRALRGDHTHPNLQPWAAEVVKKYGDAELAGPAHHIHLPQEVCRPSGVPNVHTLPGPMEILQMPGKVVILYQRDQQVRRISLNQQHVPVTRPTPYGQSVGRYEGDTLIVDTIGMTADTPVDLFGTPHSEEMHVIERYRVTENGGKLEVQITVDDPKAFKKPWSGVLSYGRTANSRWAGVTMLEEEVCAENNRDFASGAYPIPTASGPADF